MNNFEEISDNYYKCKICGKRIKKDIVKLGNHNLECKDMKYGYYWVRYDCYKIVIAQWTENKDGEDYWTFMGQDYEYEKDMCEIISYIEEPEL